MRAEEIVSRNSYRQSADVYLQQRSVDSGYSWLLFLLRTDQHTNDLNIFQTQTNSRISNETNELVEDEAGMFIPNSTTRSIVNRLSTNNLVVDGGGEDVEGNNQTPRNRTICFLL